VLGEVEETIYAADDEEEESDEVKVCDKSLSGLPLVSDSNFSKTTSRKSEMLFVRGRFLPIIWRGEGCLADSFIGDSVVLISPQVPF
jgi:U6 snRNA-associated Sm-like protein LSm3